MEAEYGGEIWWPLRSARKDGVTMYDNKTPSASNILAKIRLCGFKGNDVLVSYVLYIHMHLVSSSEVAMTNNVIGSL